jgi:hypothetical protein
MSRLTSENSRRLWRKYGFKSLGKGEDELPVGQGQQEPTLLCQAGQVARSTLFDLRETESNIRPGG